jgi:SP family galactose:H+ symporter-like MFS transporter
MSSGNINKKLVFVISAVAATGGLLFGFDTGVISGALLFLKEDFLLDSKGQEWVVSSVLLGCILGAAVSGRLVDVLGRRKAIIGTALVFAVGSIWTSAADGFSMLIAGRVVVGLGIGVASYAVPLYISEIAPPQHRGALVSLNQLLLTVGIVLSYLVDDLFANTAGSWRYMFLAGVIPALVLGVGMFFLPETPSWLTGKGRDAEAIGILNRIMPGPEAEIELAAIQQAVPESPASSVKQLRAPWLRPALLIGIGIMFVQQATGINTVIYYAPTIFEVAGFQSATTAITATVGVGLVNVLMTMVAIWLVDKVGRKPLLSYGLIGMTVSLSGLALGFQFQAEIGDSLKWMAVGMLFLYIGSFAISVGPIAWLLIAEIYPLEVRGFAMSLATLSNWVFNFIVSFTFLTLFDTIGKAGTFWLYAGVGVLGWFFCHLYVPETKGVSLETIEKNLRAGTRPKDLGSAS